MKINEIIEVSKPVFIILDKELAGVIATREENGKYFVKLMIAKYELYATQLYNQVKNKT